MRKKKAKSDHPSIPNINNQLKRTANGNDYADARTELAREQAARQRQIRLQADGELIPTDEARLILVNCAASFSVRLRGVEKQFRASFPNAPKEEIHFLNRALNDALKLMSADALSGKVMGDEG